MIKLYGISRSRAFRPLWLLHELGIEFEHVPLDFATDELQQAEYRALNPNGRIPTLVDGDLVLWESMAINLYLARRYGEALRLWPETVQGEALTWQWSFWAMTEVERPLLSALMHRRLLPDEKRDADKARRNEGLLKAPFGVLEEALSGREYLVEQRFTVADLNLAAVLSWCRPARLPLADYPSLERWLGRCLERPARHRAQHA